MYLDIFMSSGVDDALLDHHGRALKNNLVCCCCCCCCCAHHVRPSTGVLDFLARALPMTARVSPKNKTRNFRKFIT